MQENGYNVVLNYNKSEEQAKKIKEDGKYYVISTIGENSISSNRCKDGISYCESYHAFVNFYIKDTDKTISDIKMGEVAVVLSPMIDADKEYTEDDLVIVDEIKYLLIHCMHFPSVFAVSVWQETGIGLLI